MPALRFARPASARAALAVLAMAALAALAAGCAPAPGTPGVAAPGPIATGYVKTVHPEEVDLWRGVNYQGLVLDVRNPDEWDDTPGLLDGSTRIPLGELEARLPEVVAWRGKPALVFDATGPRAQAGAQLLARNGFVDVGWMEGGIEAYRRAQSQR
ncbi:MAG: rhodanese-like domain-containing protein [Candidatus Eisenbacteria bacterium]